MKALFVATIASHIKGFHTPYLKLFKDKGYITYSAAKNNLGDGVEIEYSDYFFNIPIERSPFKISNLKVIRQLRDFINNEKIDVIHCHTPMGAVVTRLAAKKARKKYGTRVIYTAHGFHFFKGAPILNWILFYPIEKYLAKYTDTLITINSEDYEFAKKKFSNKCKNIEYVPGVGIDTSKFKIQMSDDEVANYKTSLNLLKDDKVLTCVARLDKNKNQGFLINVADKLIKDDRNIHLVLAGRDELDGVYQRLVENNAELKNHIHFLGNRDDIPELLYISDLVLSASKREGLPVNVIESFASGKPVVALNCRGMKDLIINGQNGYVFDNNDVDLFSNKIVELLNDSKKYKKICLNNLEKSNYYDISNLIPKYDRIYFKK